MAALWSLLLICGAVLTSHVRCWDCVAADAKWMQFRHPNNSFSQLHTALYNDLMKHCRLPKIRIPSGSDSDSASPLGSNDLSDRRSRSRTHRNLLSRNRSRSRSQSPGSRSPSPGSRSPSPKSNTDELESACCTMQIMLEFHPTLYPEAKSGEVYKAINEGRKRADLIELPSPMMAFHTVRSVDNRIDAMATSSTWMTIIHHIDADERLIHIIPSLAVVTHDRGNMRGDVDAALAYRHEVLKGLDCVAAYAPQRDGRYNAQSYSKQEATLYHKLMKPCVLGSKQRKDAKKGNELQTLESYCCTMQLMLEFNPDRTSLAAFNSVKDAGKTGMYCPYTAFNELMKLGGYKPNGSDALFNAFQETKAIISKRRGYIHIIPSLAQLTHPKSPGGKEEVEMALEYYEENKTPFKYEDA